MSAAGNPTDISTQRTTVTVSRSGNVFEVTSQSRIHASREIAWAVLTGYDGYPDFVPGMKSSRYLSQDPLRIEQSGVFGVLFLRKRIQSTLDVQQLPMSEIRLVSVKGNLRKLHTNIRISVNDNQVVLDYHSVIEPDFWVPPFIGTPLVRAAIREKLTAVALEIEKRAARQGYQ